jgi:hypothetical protein
LNIKSVFWFSLQLLSKKILILRRYERDMIKMYTGLQATYSLFLNHFRTIIKYQISWKFVQDEPSSSMRTDAWTNMTKLIWCFSDRAS